ncbi:hypothetical protein SH668x_003734 [Planctomicrobium sp. SH668]|uniref:hypothetical protein n=1 Tax=Planctomicrobium sp. SH668 TaxID=3448126 RepID=UPI003F5B5A4B
MNFEDRLRKALQRGEKARDDRGRAALEHELSQEELRALHSRYRLELSEHIELCLKKLVDHIPGFKFQSVVSEEGWGGRITRDDLHFVPGRPPESRYSRLEVLITPFGSIGILEMSVKGTVRNREVVNRKQFQQLNQLDLDAYKESIDLRILEFAEQYAGSN